MAAREQTDIVYGEAAGEKLLLDTHVPEGDGPFPVVILVHGGGWGSGSKDGDTALLAETLADAGFVCFSINYRLAPKHRWPACLEDVRTAVRWVKAHAADHRGDPGKIALAGYSAGGHLACMAAVTGGPDERVQAVVAFAAPTDLLADTERRGGLSTSLQALLDRPEAVDAAVEKTLRGISPINHLKPGLPTFLLIHGTTDQSVPHVQSVNFQAKLSENDVACELVTIEGAPHRIAEWKNFDATYQERMTGWLEAKLAVGSQ